MIWDGEDDISDEVDWPTGSQAAMAWQGDLSSSLSHSPTGFDAADFYLANCGSTSSSPASPILTAFPTASDAADMFSSSSESDSASHAESNAKSNGRSDNVGSESDQDSESESPTTSWIENLTPSHITLHEASLPIYSQSDFAYVDDTWLPGSDDMMNTSDDE
jgi:hypothetical protein